MAEVSLELLQAMMQRVLDNQARQSEEAHDTRARLTAIERHLAALRRDNVLDAETTGNIQVQVDRLDERVERTPLGPAGRLTPLDRDGSGGRI